MDNVNLIRELEKVADTLDKVGKHLYYKDLMNSALHMSTPRRTPLGSAVERDFVNLRTLIETLKEELPA